MREPRAEPEVITYRLRRRSVMKVRPTWLAMVVVLLLLSHRELLKTYPTIGMGFAILSFIVIVIVPSVLLVLWRLGLLPPERVPVMYSPSAVNGVDP